MTHRTSNKDRCQPDTRPATDRGTRPARRQPAARTEQGYFAYLDGDTGPASADPADVASAGHNAGANKRSPDAVTPPEIDPVTQEQVPAATRKPMSVHFSSATGVWATPQELFNLLNQEFGFTVDVCALPSNAKCAKYFTPEQDGLAQDWTGTCWMNPPYGKTIGAWVRKAWESAAAGTTVVCLLPSRTDTAWWHEFVTAADEVRFVRGRIRFGGADSCAPFPSAIVIFRGKNTSDVRWTRGVFYRKNKLSGGAP